MTFPQVALSEIARPISRPIEVAPGKAYRTIGVRLWGQGAYERETIDGSQTAAKTLSVVREGDLIINKIWVRHGSTAIASQAVDGCSASGEFPTFALDKTRVEPRWLHWLTKTRAFWSKCDELSRGTSGKNRIKPELFLTIQIPVPEPSEQRRVSERIEHLVSRIEEMQLLRNASSNQANGLIRQFYALVWDECRKQAELRSLENYADVLDPQPDHRTPAEVIGGMPYVSIANISMDGTVDTLRARKVSPAAVEKQEASFTLATGDIVLGKIGTIGAARPIVVKERFALSANVVLVQPFRDRVRDKLLLALLRSPQVEEQFTSDTRTTAQGAFGIKKMRKLQVPIPPGSEQGPIVQRLEALQDKVRLVRALQAETTEELDALMPSILDKAFKGEL